MQSSEMPSSNNPNGSSSSSNYPPVETYRRRDVSPSNYESNNNNSNSNSNSGFGGPGPAISSSSNIPPPPQPAPVSHYQPQPVSSFNGYYSAPMPQPVGGNGSGNSVSFDLYPKTAMPAPSMPSPRDNSNDGKRDIRYDVDMTNKQAYRRALDQQVAEKEIAKHNQEKAKLRSELDSLKQYPFGRRTDPSSFVAPAPMDMPANYQPSFYMNNTRGIAPPAGPLDAPMRFLNKDNIVEKPNSLNADIPPYDPIKHRNGFHQGFNYDPVRSFLLLTIL